MTNIEFVNIKKTYLHNMNVNDKKIVEPTLKNFNLKINNQEFLCLFGPNGCGKTTILNLLAGLIEPDEGSILLNFNQSRKISYIFQNYNDTILPWRTNLDNLTFPLEISGFSKKEAKKKVIEFVNNFDIDINLGKYPYQMSGGQKQLLVIYRAMIYEPEVFLLDEPFSALDYDMRTSMEMELLKIWRKNKITTLFVSHEIDETILLSDRIIILSSNPANIVGEIKVDLPRPRNLNVIDSVEFNEIRKQVINIYKETKL